MVKAATLGKQSHAKCRSLGEKMSRQARLETVTGSGVFPVCLLCLSGPEAP